MDPLTTRVMLVTSSTTRQAWFAGAADPSWSVTVTTDPAEAVRAMEAASHDVFVIDARLEALPGVKVWDRARSRGLLPPAVLWTPDPEPGWIAEALDAGFLELLSGPSPAVAEVRRAVTAAWERRRLRPAEGRRSPKRRIQRAAERLRQARRSSRAKSDFLAHMTHEIRTPITGIVGMVSLLAETVLDARQREYLEILETCNESLLLLINDVLDLSKIEAGKFELETIPFELDGALEETLRVFRKQAEARGLSLTSEIDPRIPTRLAGDPGRLRQVLNNLVGNALKFTSEGGVMVRVSAVEQNPESAVLEFSVSDSGIGVPGDKLNRLFESYSQAEASTSRRFGGTGLGLSISKKLASLMGGTVGAENLPQGGARFWFTARFERQILLPGAPGDVRPAGAAPRVVLVHDQESIRAALEERLRERGLEPIVARSVPEAWAALERSAGEPVVAVIGMQENENGALTLARDVRANPTFEHVRLIRLQETGHRGDAARAQEAGFDAYLTRPYSTETLLRCVRRITAVEPTGTLVTRHTLRDETPPAAPTVLVVEDDSTSRKLAVRFLRKLGFRVDAAENGAAGLAAYREGDYAVVIMDCQMPEMDGIETARRIRAWENGAGRRTPIIALTAFALKEYRDRCLGAGMDGFLTKPVTLADLADAVAGFVPLPAQQAA